MIVYELQYDRDCAEAERDARRDVVNRRVPVPGSPGSHRLSGPTLTTARHDPCRPTIRLSVRGYCHAFSAREYTTR